MAHTRQLHGQRNTVSDCAVEVTPDKGAFILKTTLNLVLLGGAILLATATESRALPPRQHVVSGVITAIDYDGHTITVAPTKGSKSFIFVWKKTTRFSQGWSRICLGALESGQNVKVHYRREVDQLVPREVSLRTETPVRCTTGVGCAKRSG